MSSVQPNILVYSPKQAETYAKAIQSFGLTSVKAAANEEEAKRYLPRTEVILGWRFPAHLLNQNIATSVRWFQSTGAGVDDLMADPSFPKDIFLTRIVDQFGQYISEYVFTYLLHILKDVPRMTLSQQERRWDPFISDTLAGKTIGVAGLGSIGAEIVRKARAFDMKIYGLSASGKHSSLVDVHFLPREWNDFAEKLDYLILTLPLTKDTYHVINKDILLSMKKDACLINVGRGGLIAENDLLSALESGRLKAAVLDVFETEPLPANHAFYSISNVYITSHLSGPSTVEGVTHFFIENLKRYINNQPLKGLVERSRGY